MNRMRQLFQRGDSNTDTMTGDMVDIEGGTHGRPAAPVSAPPANPAQSLNPAQQLSAFRQLVGITQEPDASTPSNSKKSGSKRAAPNVGIYARVTANETSAKRSYTAYSWIITGCLGAQVLVAAALTAMGAASINHSIITAFGAVNTAIAGFHTYLQGYGLPGRLKYYQDAWHKVRETIEQRERDFTSAATFGTPLPAGTSLASAVADIEKLYNDTVTEMQANAPDSYKPNSKPGSSGQSPQQPGSNTPPPGTAPPTLHRGDVRTSDVTAEQSGLQSPEKAHFASAHPSATEAQHSGLEQEVKTASSSETSS